MISAVVLNWRRFKNVRKIVSELDSYPEISQIIVWNNQSSRLVNDREMRPGDVSIVNCNRDFGLMTRFTAALLAKNSCVLFIDDDLLITAKGLKTLYGHWKKDPQILHGKFGRRPRNRDNSYADDVRGDGRTPPIVLTRVLMMHKVYAAKFFIALPEFPELLEAKPVGNGEDILLSYVVISITGRPNAVHRFETIELPAPHAIHGRWSGHYRYRTKLMRKCQEWLQSNRRT